MCHDFLNKSVTKLPNESTFKFSEYIEEKLKVEASNKKLGLPFGSRPVEVLKDRSKFLDENLDFPMYKIVHSRYQNEIEKKMKYLERKYKDESNPQNPTYGDFGDDPNDFFCNLYDEPEKKRRFDSNLS